MKTKIVRPDKLCAQPKFSPGLTNDQLKEENYMQVCCVKILYSKGGRDGGREGGRKRETEGRKE